MTREFNLRASPEFDLPPDRTALIIVDMQRAGLYPNAGLSALHARQAEKSYQEYQQYARSTLIPNNVRLLERFRALGMRVIFLTCGSFYSDAADMYAPRRRMDLETQKRTGVKTTFTVGEHEHGVIDELTPRSDEPVFNKLGSDGFIGTALDQVLRWMRIDTMVVTGVGTPYCVESTVRHGADLGYAVAVASDACGTSDMTLHEHSLRVMHQRYAMVRTTAEILAMLPQPAAARRG
ncbi:MAG: cysteine hydrolase [Armatimonadetes bacterium]|nr:cysteine hydrolase [Armatimonadota bacterium]